MDQVESPRKGFTIIEVALVLAISGLVLIGIMSGVTGSVARQRYNDSVQSIIEQFRVIYNQANNPQSLNGEGGNDDNRAIYGKLVEINSNSNQGNALQLTTYTVTGSADSTNSSNTSAILGALQNAAPAILTGSAETYTAPWEARLQRSGHLNDDQLQDADDSRNFKGMLLIIHSPNGGAIHTYYRDNISTSLDELTSNYHSAQLDFCVNSPDLFSAGSTRRNIRLTRDGRNASAVQLIDVDSEGEEGNQCR